MIEHFRNCLVVVALNLKHCRHHWIFNFIANYHANGQLLFILNKPCHINIWIRLLLKFCLYSFWKKETNCSHLFVRIVFKVFPNEMFCICRLVKFHFVEHIILNMKTLNMVWLYFVRVLKQVEMDSQSTIWNVYKNIMYIQNRILYTVVRIYLTMPCLHSNKQTEYRNP